jgi:hypothetical protein
MGAPTIIQDMFSRWPPDSLRFRLAFGTLQLLMVCGMFVIFLQTFELNGDPRSTLIKMMTGAADRPFVYRVLVPGVIRVTSVLTPLSAPTVALMVMWLSLAGFALAFRSLARRFITQPILAETAVLLGLVGLYFSFYFGKIYDFTILFLFTLELVLMQSRRWRIYLLLFPIACLVKETTALLGLVFALHYFRTLDRRTFWTLLLSQVVVFLAIRLAITWIFRNNPGNALEFHLLDHYRAFRSQPIFFSLWLLMLAAVAGAVAYSWRNKPLFLRHAALATALPLLILFFSSGGPYELRNLYEAYPAVFLLCFLSLELRLAVRPQSSQV